MYADSSSSNSWLIPVGITTSFITGSWLCVIQMIHNPLNLTFLETATKEEPCKLVCQLQKILDILVNGLRVLVLSLYVIANLLHVTLLVQLYRSAKRLDTNASVMLGALSAFWILTEGLILTLVGQDGSLPELHAMIGTFLLMHLGSILYVLVQLLKRGWKQEPESYFPISNSSLKQ